MSCSRRDGVSFRYGHDRVLDRREHLRAHRASSRRSPDRTVRGSRRCCGSLLGLLAPASGTVELFGVAPATSATAGAWATCRSACASRPTSRRPSRRWSQTGRLAKQGWWRRSRAVRPGGRRPRASSRCALADHRARAAHELSGGQQQRALIAKALAADPSCWCSTNRSPASTWSRRGCSAIRSSTSWSEHDAAVLLVSHELGAVADDLDHMIVLKRRVVFDGAPAELAATGVSLGVHRDDLPLWLEELQLTSGRLARDAVAAAVAVRPHLHAARAARGHRGGRDRAAHRRVPRAEGPVAHGRRHRPRRGRRHRRRLLLDTSPTWTAMVVRHRGRAGDRVAAPAGSATGDLALALVFYGGIAAGVVLASRSATNTNLQPYLFGSILTATADDVWTVHRARRGDRRRHRVHRTRAARGRARRRLRPRRAASPRAC